MTAVVLVALAGVGCSSDGDRPASQTPRVTTDNTTSELKSALLTTADVRAVQGLPNDLAVTSLDDMSVYEDPDPRGPCGAKIAPPDFSDGVGVAFRSTSLGGFHFVVEPLGGAAGTYIDRLAEDTQQGCAPYDSTTNTGTTQHVQLVRTIELRSIGDQSHAAILEITNQGQTFSAAELVVRRGEVMSFLVIFSPTEPSDQVVMGLAEVVAGRLASL